MDGWQLQKDTALRAGFARAAAGAMVSGTDASGCPARAARLR